MEINVLCALPPRTLSPYAPRSHPITLSVSSEYSSLYHPRIFTTVTPCEHKFICFMCALEGTVLISGKRFSQMFEFSFSLKRIRLDTYVIIIDFRSDFLFIFCFLIFFASFFSLFLSCAQMNVCTI